MNTPNQTKPKRARCCELFSVTFPHKMGRNTPRTRSPRPCSASLCNRGDANRRTNSTRAPPSPDRPGTRARIPPCPSILRPPRRPSQYLGNRTGNTFEPVSFYFPCVSRYGLVFACPCDHRSCAPSASIAMLLLHLRRCRASRTPSERRQERGAENSWERIVTSTGGSANARKKHPSSRRSGMASPCLRFGSGCL